MRSGGFHRQYNAAGLDLRRRKTSRRPITKLQPGKGCLGTGDAVGGRRAAVSQGRTSALGGTQSPAGWVVCCGLTGRRNRSSNRCARRRCAGRTGANPRRRSHSAFRPSCDASGSTHAGRPCGAAGTPCRRSSFAADCPTARLRPVEVGGTQGPSADRPGLFLAAIEGPPHARRWLRRPGRHLPETEAISSGRDPRLRRFNREASQEIEGSVRRLVTPAPGPWRRQCSRRGWCRPGRRR